MIVFVGIEFINDVEYHIFYNSKNGYFYRVRVD